MVSVLFLILGRLLVARIRLILHPDLVLVVALEEAWLADAVRVVRLVGVAALVRPLRVANVEVTRVAHES